MRILPTPSIAAGLCYTRWRDNGLFDRMLKHLQVELDAEGRIDPELWCVDSTDVRASRSAAGAGNKRAHLSRPITRSA